MSEKIYIVVRRHKITKNQTLKTPRRVIRCECGRLVSVNKKGEIERHCTTTYSNKTCPMTWKKVKCNED